MRLIEADAVYKILESCEIRKATIGNPLTDWEYGYTCGIERAESEIECAPTADAVPVSFIKEQIEKLQEIADYEFIESGGYLGECNHELRALQDLLKHWAERKE